MTRAKPKPTIATREPAKKQRTENAAPAKLPPAKTAVTKSALAAELPQSATALVSFDVDDRAVESIAARIEGWLALGDADRRSSSEALRATVERLWSWEGVARGVLAASSGELDGLPIPVDA